MLQLKRANEYWWRKPLVLHQGRPVPAELAVLAHELGRSEQGVWLNSRSKASGVVDLELVYSKRTYHTVRRPLPLFVAAMLEQINQRAGVANGCPDLVIWCTDREQFRLVEVKCPHWDRPSKSQVRFIEVARSLGIPASIAEWEFTDAG